MKTTPIIREFLFIKESDKMIKRIIFDVDGTLIASTNFRNAQINTLKSHNLLTEENLKNFGTALVT